MIVLYRLWNSAHELLYVGLTGDPERRLADHRAFQEWGDEIAYMTQDERFTNRYVAYRAEVQAIRADRPRYNVQHHLRARAPRA